MTSFTTTDGARPAYFIDDFTDPCIPPSGGSTLHRSAPGGKPENPPEFRNFDPAMLPAGDMEIGNNGQQLCVCYVAAYADPLAHDRAENAML